MSDNGTQPTKVLWHSNGPHVASGYGAQTALFTPKLAEHYDVYISANYGLDGAPIVWNGIPVLPGLGQTHGNEALPGHISGVFGEPRGGLVVTLYDAQVFNASLFAKFNVACWTPVDCEPPPPALIAFFRESHAIPFAITRFGEQELAEFDPIYVPHGVDLDTYKPTPSNVREQMGIDKDAFVVGMVAANKGRPSRKCFQQAFEAFKHFHDRHDNAYLYIHSVLSPEWAGGEDLPALLASLEIPEEAVRYPNQYSLVFSPPTSKRMAELYSSFDVLLNPSMGEGFGIPIAEAQACGVPVIVTDFSAMKEVCGAGWKIKGRAYWTGQHSWMAIPDVGDLVGALEDCYGLSDTDRKALSLRAQKHVEQYGADKVFEEHMLPALTEVEERIGNLKPLRVAA